MRPSKFAWSAILLGHLRAQFSVYHGKREAMCFKGQVEIVQSDPQYNHLLQPSAALGLGWGSRCFSDTAQEYTKYRTKNVKRAFCKRS